MRKQSPPTRKDRPSRIRGTPVRRREPIAVVSVDRTFARALGKIRQAIRAKRATLPDSSPLRTYLDALLELSDEPLMDVVAAHAYGNPERNGCPPYRILIDLATHEAPLSDPVWDHVRHCHPCALKIRTLRRALRPPPN